MKKVKKEGQWLSARDVMQLIAKEKAKRYIDNLPFKEYRANLKELEKEETEKNFKVLQSYLEEDTFILHTPFIDEFIKFNFPIRVAFLVDIVDEYDLPIKMLCKEVTEDYVLSLNPAQRERCYVINNHRIQGFKVQGNKVVFEDILTIDEKQRYYRKSKREDIKKGKEKLKRDLEKRLFIISETLGYMQKEYEEIERAIQELNR